MSFKEEMENLLPEVLIHNVTFDHREGLVEITFAELRDQADGVGMLKIASAERELFYTEIDDLESDLRDLVSEVETAIRNDDARQTRVDRAMKRYRKDEDDEEDDNEVVG